jgi:hypothetical protein
LEVEEALSEPPLELDSGFATDHHHSKGATPMVHFSHPTERSSRQATKSNTQLRSNAREIAHVNTETPQPLRWSEFPITFSRKEHWVHILNPGTYTLVVNPIVDGAFLPKTLIDGGSSLNIIFTETLRKMDFDFNKMTACDQPFYGSCMARLRTPYVVYAFRSPSAQRRTSARST